MGFGLNGKQINNSYSFGLVFVLKTSLLVLILSNIYYCSTLAEGKHHTDKHGKKKVVIVGEMSDMFANDTIRSSGPNIYKHSEDYDNYEEEDPNHDRFRRFKPIDPNEIRPIPKGHTQYVRRKSKPGGSMFVPVAAYSITKTKNKPYRQPTNGYRKRQGGPSKSFIADFSFDIITRD